MTLLSVADALDVPEATRARFLRLLEMALKEAWRGYGIARGIPRQSPVNKVLERLRTVPPARALKLLKKDDATHDAAATYLACAVAPIDVDQWIMEASKTDRSSAIDGAQGFVRRDLREGGRPPGTPNNPAFDLFVHSVYWFAVACDGRPGSASRKGTDPVGGRIPKALEMLKQELPPDFIPAEGSILKAVKRAQVSWDKQK